VTQTIWKALRRFEHELDNLDQLVQAPRPVCDSGLEPWTACATAVALSELPTTECCTLRLHDSWARYCRSVVFASAADEPSALDGSIIARAPGIASRDDVWPHLAARLRAANRPCRYEPRWGDATQCANAVDMLGLSNSARLKAALQYQNSPVETLRLLRNFYAHRCDDTGHKLPVVRRELRLAPNVDPGRIPGTPYGNSVVLRVWIAQLRIMATAMVNSA